MATLQGKVCTSCGRLTDRYALFKCPSCSGDTIIRCHECRMNHTRYRCTQCEFEGP